MALLKKVLFFSGLFIFAAPWPLAAQTAPMRIAPSITDEELRELRDSLKNDPPPPGDYGQAPGPSAGEPENAPEASPAPAVSLDEDRGGLNSPFEGEKAAAGINNLRAEGQRLKKARDQQEQRIIRMLGSRKTSEADLIQAYQEFAALNSGLDQKRLEFIMAQRRRNLYWSPKSLKQIEREFTDHKIKARAN